MTPGRVFIENNMNKDDMSVLFIAFVLAPI